MIYEKEITDEELKDAIDEALALALEQGRDPQPIYDLIALYSSPSRTVH